VPISESARESSRAAFSSAEQLGEAPDRAAQLSRLSLYRRAAFDGLAAMAPAEAPRTWPSLLLGLPALTPEMGQALSGSPEDDALTPEALQQAIASVRQAATMVLDLLTATEHTETLRVQQRVHSGATWFVVGLAVAFFSARGVTTAFASSDLAKGKPWRASSTLVDCHPDRLDCGGARTGIFFHTREENDPWVEIDLGVPTRFGSVTVQNRSDAVPERAVPLVLEVGTDGKSWQELARRDDPFHRWTAKFEPVEARYVRLRAPRVTMLHLDAVEVYR
jgi:hypothetical protein